MNCRTKPVWLLSVTTVLMACTAPAIEESGVPDVEYINVPGALDLPFSSAVRVGDMLYLSGQIGTAPGSGLVEGGVGPETAQTLANIESVLDYAGSSRDRIVKCTVFLLDIADYAAMNAAYADFFGDRPPARSTVAGSGLALGARVEIECLALSGV